MAQHRGEWDVLTERGMVRAVLAGRLYEALERTADGSAFQPTVGDWVLVSAPTVGKLHVIERPLKRRTHLERGAAGRRRTPQTIVANVDVVVVVCQLPAPGVQDAVARRSINPRRIERYLAAIDQGGADAVIALNKADLCPEATRIAAELKERFACPIVTTSTLTAEGLDSLRALLRPGMTVGLVGLSGVGKSSLVNALLGHEVQKTGAERAQDARGRHTTTHRELFTTADGVLLVDTPGMREFALSADEDDLGGFEDVQRLAEGCRFRDCRHQQEPGCAVRAAVERGELSVDRLQSYHQLSEELAEQQALRLRGGRGKSGASGSPSFPGRPRRGHPKAGRSKTRST